MEVHTKKERAAWLDEKFTEMNIPSYGRQKRICEQADISAPTAQAILLGSVPREATTGLRFAESFGLVFEEWVTGSRSFQTKLEKAVGEIRRFEKEARPNLSTEKFAQLVVRALEDPDYAEKFTADVVLLFGEESSEK